LEDEEELEKLFELLDAAEVEEMNASLLEKVLLLFSVLYFSSRFPLIILFIISERSVFLK
jgi:hypothetical protein